MLHGAGIFTYIDLHGWVICSGVGKYYHGAYGEWDHSIQDNSGITMNDNNHWLVVSNVLYFPFHIWDNPNPIDELIFFKMVKLHHQPDHASQLGIVTGSHTHTHTVESTVFLF